MRKRVFGSIFLTSLVTLLLTTGLLLLAVHAGLTNDMRQRLVTESSYLSAVDNIRGKLEKFGSVYADRLTLVAQDGTVLYDNRTNASEMENHAVRPEIAAAEKNGTGEDNRLSETFAKQTFYYAVRLKNGDVLRISATADSVFGALSNASPWIVLIILLALLASYFLKHTRPGLHLRAVGESASTADAAGINVTRYKYLATCIGSMIAGLGGLYYVMDYANGVWSNNAFGDRGWLAIALVIFTIWRPNVSILASILFGGLYILNIYLPTGAQMAVKELYKMLPYVITLIVLIIVSLRKKREDQPPASLGLSYFREER